MSQSHPSRIPQPSKIKPSVWRWNQKKSRLHSNPTSCNTGCMAWTARKTKKSRYQSRVLGQSPAHDPLCFNCPRLIPIQSLHPNYMLKVQWNTRLQCKLTMPTILQTSEFEQHKINFKNGQTIKSYAWLMSHGPEIIRSLPPRGTGPFLFTTPNGGGFFSWCQETWQLNANLVSLTAKCLVRWWTVDWTTQDMVSGSFQHVYGQLDTN